MSSLDSGFHLPDSALWIPDSPAWITDSRSIEIRGRKSSCILDVLKRLDSGFRHPDCGFRTTGFRIPKQIKIWISGFGLPYVGRHARVRVEFLPVMLSATLMKDGSFLATNTVTEFIITQRRLEIS